MIMAIVLGELFPDMYICITHMTSSQSVNSAFVFRYCNNYYNTL